MREQQVRRIGVIMNGVTGRMGTNQHLMRSIVPIIKQGGIKAGDSRTIVPDPILVGRNADKLRKLVEMSGIAKWSTDVPAVLADPAYSVYFDAQTTDRRAEWVRKAIDAGKHIYCEKPTATTTEDAYSLHVKAKAAGVKNGVVQDKLWLPGMVKLKKLIGRGFFGKILSVRGEFGYWVFEGDRIEAQRPSWNYRKEDGGGIILDMFCHWRYLLDNIFGAVKSVSCLGATQIPLRWDEQGRRYDCTADDSAYATFELAGGIVAQFNSLWCTRVRRDDLLTLQVDGTAGSAVAGLKQCRVQAYEDTPKLVWNPDVDSPVDLFGNWTLVDADQTYDNAFKAQWELFLRHVALDEPFQWTLLEGAKGVQLAEMGMASWAKRAWVLVPALSL